MKWENGEKERERKRRKAGRSIRSLAGQTLESLPHETKGGGCQTSCKLRELLTPTTEIATMVMLASYESSQHCIGVVACLCSLWNDRHFT